MKIPTLSKKDIQIILTEKIIRLRTIYENFIIKKLGKNISKELNQEEIKVRLSDLKKKRKIKNSLQFVIHLAISDKNEHGSKVQIHINKEKIIYINQECGYLRKETKKRKQICCKPCLAGRLSMANSFGFKVEGSLLPKGCKLIFWK